MLNASQDRIDLWLVEWKKLVGSYLLQQYQEVLSDQEREQEAGFRFENDRVRHRVTRASVRTVLSKYVTVRPEDWCFSENAYGRPAIANEMPEARSISFNVAHAGMVIVLAITKTAKMGVDIERIEGKGELIDVADRYFSKREVASLRALPKGQQLRRFFEYWTLKESYIKARGLGLSLPLDQFSFDLQSPDAISFRIENDRDSKGYRFWQAEHFGDYLVSVCAESIGKIVPEVVVRRVIPFQSEELLPSNVIRRSIG
jgi:4'-phosphopantetheinyl transferase